MQRDPAFGAAETRACGSPKDTASFDDRVADRVENIQDHFRVAQGYERRAATAVEEAGDFKGLVKAARPRDVLIAAPRPARERQDSAALRTDRRSPGSLGGAKSPGARHFML